jgi:hypothetical protein
MATCPTCEAEFTPKPNHHPVPRYCQRACKERAAARRRRAPIVAANKAAREAAPSPAPPPPRTCLECGVLVSSARVRVCSAPCRRARKQRYDRAYNQGRPRRDPGCERCGAATPAPGRKRCDPCLAQTRGARKRRERVRRRALERAVVHDNYTLAEIAQRDRYRCGLCRTRVAMTQVVPHPRSPTIDHVLPLAVGGQDVRANVQLAHFSCNVAKRDKGTQQLALIG